MDYQWLCQESCQIIKEASLFIKKEYDRLKISDINFKDRNDLVSYVDIETEKFLVNKLAKLLPGSEFLAEESYTGVRGITENPTWIIDPLDGTTNYIHHIPVFSVSVALQVDKITRVGIVYEIVRDDCFYCWENGGAWLNGKAISVSKNHMLNNALLATGFPFKEFEIKERYIRILSEFMLQTRGLRRLGSAAVDLAYVSCGRFDGFFEFNLSPWDVAAGAFIVEQAGGKVSDFSAGNNYLFGKEILASSQMLYPYMLKIISG